jgi:long-chain fatty acid transport protein
VGGEAHKILIRLSFVFAASLACASARAQAPSPTPPPDRLFQDELDLQASLNVVQGSGARALGMGGAFLARADDATAASWNPAGLSYLRLPEASFVWLHNQLTTRSRTLADALQTVDDRSGNSPDFVAFAFPYEVGRVSGSAQISYQRVIAFGGERSIEDVDQTRTVSSSGGFDVLALGTGLRLSRTLRGGLTVNHWFNGYDQVVVREQREVPTRQMATFDLSGWNIHAGLIWSPIESLNLGAVFKSAFHANASLKRSRLDRFPSGPTNNSFSRDNLGLDLPGAIGLGASWRPRSNLTLALDFTRTDWSEGRISNFFTLQRADVGVTPPVPTEPRDSFKVLPYPTLNDARQQDTTQLRGGAEYVILGKRLKWPIRVGYFTDQQFFRAADGHAPVLTGLTFGAGVILGSVLVDGAWVYERGSYLSRDELPTTVKSHRVYVSLIYRHARKP